MKQATLSGSTFPIRPVTYSYTKVHPISLPLVAIANTNHKRDETVCLFVTTVVVQNNISEAESASDNAIGDHVKMKQIQKDGIFPTCLHLAVYSACP